MMPIDKHILCQAKGTIKYDCMSQFNNSKWFTGTLTLRKDPHHKEVRIDVSLEANPKAGGRSVKITQTNIKRLTCPPGLTRLLLQLNDTHGSSFSLKEAKPEAMEAMFKSLKAIQEGNVKFPQDTTAYQSHSDSILKTPNRSLKTPSTNLTPKQDFQNDKENASQGSAKKFTSVKSRSGDNDRSSNSNSYPERGKSLPYLQRASEKANESLELQQQSVKAFYNKDSDVFNNRSYGPFGIQSNVKRGPQLLSISAGPKAKRPRIMGTKADYIWRKSSQYSSSHKPNVASLQGFSNLGNTCYMNAILQALFNLETFSADIRNEDLHRKMPNNENLFKSLAHLLQCKKSQCSIEKRRAALRQVKSAISTTAKRFSGYQQHDAHEFLNQVLDQLKEEIIKASRPQPTLDQDEDNVPDQELLLNPTSMNFEFEIIHTITCQQCHEQVTKTEQFNDLSVDMPKKYKNCLYPLSLQDALDNFLRKESIEYKCEECGHKMSEVTHKFAKLPRVLILHLKRYSFSTLAANYKTAKDINIPKFIALEQHCEEDTSPPQPPAIHMTPQKRPPHRKPMDLDSPDGTRRQLDLESSGCKKFTFKKVIRSSDSEDEFQSQRKPLPPKARADLEKFRAVEASLMEQQKQEEAKRREDRELKQVLELSKSEARKAQEEQKRVKEFPLGCIPESQLEKMSEEDMIKLAMNQSAMEAEIMGVADSKTGTPGVSENSQCNLGHESVEVDHVKPKGVKSEDVADSESDIEMTGLKKPALSDVKEGFSEVFEYSDSYSESAVEEYLVNDGRPATPPGTDDSEKDKMEGYGEVFEYSDSYSESAVEEYLVNDGRPATPPGTDDSDKDKTLNPDCDSMSDDNGAGDNSQPNKNGAGVDGENSVQNVTVKPSGAGGDAFFTGDMDDSVLLENDEFSGQEQTYTAWQSVTETVVLSSDDDFESTPDKSRRRAKSEQPSERTPDHLHFSRKGNSRVYSRSENKLKSNIDDYFKPFRSKPKTAFTTSSKGFDSVDGLSSSRKKKPDDDEFQLSEGSDEDKSRWESLKGRKISRKVSASAVKPQKKLGHDEVDLSYPEDDMLNKYNTSSQPREGSSVPKLTPPDHEWSRKYNQDTEEQQMADVLEKSKLDTGGDFDDEELRKALELSLLEGINFLPPDVEKDENDNEVEVELTEEEYKILRENSEKGDLPYSYQLTSVVCHLGSSSSAGHYVSDVYDIRKQAWFSFDDSRVEKTTEKDVRSTRKKCGYIFFYMNKDAVEELKEYYSNRNETQSKPESRYSL